MIIFGKKKASATAAALLEGLNYKNCGADLSKKIYGVTCDSREVKKGCAFVCVEGTKLDGHDFAAAAKKNGAALIVAKREIEGVPTVQVEDERAALAVMACNFYGNPSKKMKIIGVTGTNGKTTVTYLLKQVLESCGCKVGLIGTISNMIGPKAVESAYTTPDPVVLQKLLRQMADEGCDYVVMEVSSHSLAQKRVAGINFAVAIFTNLTQDHLDYHGTMEKYLEAKAEIFRQSEFAVLNADDESIKYLQSRVFCPKATYSANTDYSDYTAKDIRLSSGGVKFLASAKNVLEPIELKIPGRFTVYNALSVFAACCILGFPPQKIREGLLRAKGVKGRIEVVPVDADFTVIIDYAHTPDGLYNILSSVKDFAEGRVIALFGCGGDRDRDKRPKMGRIATEIADFSIVTSDNPRTEDPDVIISEIVAGIKAPKSKYMVVADRREAIRRALEIAAPKDVVVLAGKGHETYQAIGSGKIHFDEREIVEDILLDN